MESNVYNIDCNIFMRDIPNKYFDLVIIDPPYGINAPNMKMGQNNGYISTAVKLKGRLNSGSGKLKNRLLNSSLIDWDNEIPSDDFFNEIFRISKHQIIFGGNYFNLPPTRCIIVWDKCQPWENFSQVEIAWTSFDKPAKLYRISNIGGNNNEVKIHPTQKPIKLYECIYRDFATEGIKVFDSHLGSGSNRIAADKANVHFTGTEINEQYFNDSINRFNKYSRQQKIIFSNIQTKLFD